MTKNTKYTLHKDHEELIKHALESFEGIDAQELLAWTKLFARKTISPYSPDHPNQDQIARDMLEIMREKAPEKATIITNAISLIDSRSKGRES
jgi:hypothetical protein